MSIKRKYKTIIKKFIEIDPKKLGCSDFDLIIKESKEMLQNKLSKIIIFCNNPRIEIKDNKIIISYNYCSKDLDNIVKGFGNKVVSHKDKMLIIKDQLVDLLILLNDKLRTFGSLDIKNNTDYSIFDYCDLSSEVFELFNDDYLNKLINDKKIIGEEVIQVEEERESWIYWTEDKVLSHKETKLSTVEIKPYQEAIENFSNKYESFRNNYKRNMQNGLAECVIAKAHANNITNVVKKEEKGVIYVTLES